MTQKLDLTEFIAQNIVRKRESSKPTSIVQTLTESNVVDCGRKPTIGEAANAYRQRGVQSVHPGYRQLVEHSIDSKVKTVFKNESYLDALFLMEMMFDRAQHHVRLFSGPAADGFLNVLQESFSTMLYRLRAKGGNIKLILIAEELPPYLKELRDLFPGTLDVALARTTEQLRHFTVCDSKMARFEEVHSDLNVDSPSDAVKATIYFHEPEMIRQLENLFDYMWKLVKPESTKAK